MPHPSPPPGYNPHPVKLVFVCVKKISFDGHVLPKDVSMEALGAEATNSWDAKVEAKVGNTKALTMATVRCSAATHPEKSKDQTPSTSANTRQSLYDLEVVLAAGFEFDPEEYSKEKVTEWCEKGSFYIFAPYVRTLVAQITREAGFPEVLLPMLAVPTFVAPTVKQLAGKGGEVVATPPQISDKK